MNAFRYITAASFCSLLSLASFAAEPPAPAPDANASEKPKWFVIEDTTSPNGKYALAWTVRDEPAIWDEVCKSFRERERREYEDDTKLEVPSEKVENLLIDTKDGKVLTTVPSYFWALPHARPNRHFIEAAWSPNSDLLIVNHTFRWDCLSISAVSLADTAKPKVVEILKPLVAAAQKFAKSSPGAKEHSSADLNVCFSEVKHFKGNTFRAQVDTVAGKAWAAEPAQVDFAIVSGKSAPTVKVFRIGAR